MHLILLPPPSSPLLVPSPLGVFSMFSGSKGKSPKGPGGVKLISTNALSSLGEREGGKEKEGGREYGEGGGVGRKERERRNAYILLRIVAFTHKS